MTAPLRDYRSSPYRDALLSGLAPQRQPEATDPYTMPLPASLYQSSDDLLAGYERRNEGAGGVWKGAATGAALGSRAGWYGTAAGALIGGIAGAATKNAETAMTDFSDTDARSAINEAYRRYLGRQASSPEVEDQLRGQGYRADQGHRWVGEAGLRSVLDSIQNSEEAQQYGLTGTPRGAAASPGNAPAGASAGTSPAGPTSGFTGGSGALVDPYALPSQDSLQSLLANAQRYTDYDASTGRTGMAGGATGAGGYTYAGFDFGQDPGNRDIGKSAKYAFSHFAEQAGAQGAPMPRTKAEAEQWFNQYIAPQMQAAGYEVEWVQGDKARIRTREGWDEIDFLIGADGDNPTLGWQSEVLSPGPQMSGGATGAAGRVPASGDLASSALFDQLLQQAQDIAAGRQTGAPVLDRESLLALLAGR